MTHTPPPDAILGALTAYQHTAAIRAAIELDVFTAIENGAATLEALAKSCGASARGLRPLCDYLVVHGHLTKSGNSYGLTPASSAYLVRGKPACLGETITFLDSAFLRASFDTLTDAVRKGGCAVSDDGTMSTDNDVWISFARAMVPMAHPLAVAVGDLVEAEGWASNSVVDIAAGHGLYGLELAVRNPGARIHAIDWANVLSVAVEHADARGVGDRFVTIEGDAFKVDWGVGHDLVLLPNFLHHFDADGCTKVLTKARAALKPGGRVIGVEIAPDDDRVTPPSCGSFALVMLATTATGDAHTAPEYRAMFRAAGFANMEARRVPGMDQTLLIAQA